MQNMDVNGEHSIVEENPDSNYNMNRYEQAPSTENTDRN